MIHSLKVCVCVCVGRDGTTPSNLFIGILVDTTNIYSHTEIFWAMLEVKP